MTENTPASATRRGDTTRATLTDPPPPLAVAIDSINWSMDGALDRELLACQQLTLPTLRAHATYHPDRRSHLSGLSNCSTSSRSRTRCGSARRSSTGTPTRR